MSSHAISSRFSAGRADAPQSIRKLASRPETWKQVLSLPPEPKASPQPTKRNCIGCGLPKLYRRGVPNTRESSQIGITMTAPSRK
ncbi:hypothetical protein ABH979_000748 [Bradyrhizobium ottawaense]